MTKTLDFTTLESILDAFGISVDDYSYRESYQGRGFSPKGFGLVLPHSAVLPLMAAAGAVGAEDKDFDAMAFAKAAETDSMGFDTIVYWPGWKVENVPEWFGIRDND